MEKRLISTAVAGLLAGSMAAIAHADIMLYGNVNISYDYFDVDEGSEDQNLNSNTSAVGVKGSEDLGVAGLKALWQAEFQLDPANRSNGGGVTGRDQFVGLAGDKWGKVRFGTLSTSYKSHGAMIDPIYRTSLQGRNFGLQSDLHNGAGPNGQGRMTNHIRYDSPSFYGAKITLDYALDRENIATVDKDTWGVGFQYKGYGALIFADYLTNQEGGKDSAWKVGGKYKYGMFGLYGQYEYDDGLISSIGGLGVVEPAPGAPSNTTRGQHIWHVGGSAEMGNFLAYFAYGQGKRNNKATDPFGGGFYKTFTLALDYKFSKLTDLYLGYNQIDCNGSTGNTLCSGVGTGLKRPRTSPNAARGGEQDFFSIGLRKKF